MRIGAYASHPSATVYAHGKACTLESLNGTAHAITRPHHFLTHSRQRDQAGTDSMGAPLRS